LSMILLRSQEKIALHPDAEQLLERLQQEYDELINKVNAFYAARKALLASKRDQLIADVENSEAMTQYQEIKLLLAEQRRSWQNMVEKLA